MTAQKVPLALHHPSYEVVLLFLTYTLVVGVLFAAIAWDAFVLRSAHETPHITLGEHNALCDTV